MRIGFFAETKAWITGKALHLCNPGSIYDERSHSHGQVLIAERIVADLDQLNDALKRIPVVGASSDEFLLSKDDFRRLKDFLKRHGRVVEESETRIVVEEGERR